jgi:hypothetical protein
MKHQQLHYQAQLENQKVNAMISLYEKNMQSNNF